MDTDTLPADWPGIVSAFDAWADGRRVRPGSAFRGLGKNFMSPEILGYVRAGRHVVEVSTGTGFDGTRLLGLTVARTPDARPHPADGAFWSFSELDAALESLTDG